MTNEKFLKFEEFKNDLGNKKGSIKNKMDNIGANIELLKKELKVINLYAPGNKEFAEQVKEESAKKPSDKKLAEKATKLEVLSQREYDRIDGINYQLERYEKEYAELKEKHGEFNITQLAKDAVKEQFDGIVELQHEFTAAINAAEAAKVAYLEAVVEVGRVRSEGNHAVERLARCINESGLPYPSHAQFDTRLTPHTVTMDDIKTAYFRGKI